MPKLGHVPSSTVPEAPRQRGKEQACGLCCRNRLGEATSPTPAASCPALPGLGSVSPWGPRECRSASCPASPSRGRIGRELTQGRQSPSFAAQISRICRSAQGGESAGLTTMPKQGSGASKIRMEVLASHLSLAFCSVNPGGFRV